MRKSIVGMILACLSVTAFAGGGGHNQKPPENYLGDATAVSLQGQYQSTSSTAKSDSKALAGAYSGSLSGSESNSSAKSGDSISGAVGIGGDSASKANAEGGTAHAKSGDSSSLSGATSSSGDSSSGSTSDNQVTVSSFHQGDRYPDIPVNAGVVFASVCQEGSSATNSKISISLVTDSSFCNRLQMADSFRVMFQYYAKACNTDINTRLATYRHKLLVASQVKGAVPMTEWDYDEEPVNCDHAEDYRVKMGDELAKAQTMLDRTSFTGLIAKWSTQLGIPVSLMYVIVAVL